MRYLSLGVALMMIWESNAYCNERTLPRLQVVTEEWPPYNYTNQKGQVVGRATSQVRRLLKAAHIDYELQSYPWPRSIQQAKNNSNTMIYSIFQTAERLDDFLWLCPLLDSPKIYLFRLLARHDLEFSSIEQLSGHSVAVVNDDVTDQYFKQQLGGLDIHVDNSSLGDVNFRKLVAGRIDFMASTEFTMLEHVKRNHLDKHGIVAQIPILSAVEEPLCMAFNKQTDPRIVAKIAEVMRWRSLK